MVQVIPKYWDSKVRTDVSNPKVLLAAKGYWSKKWTQLNKYLFLFTLNCEWSKKNL
jgi:hypothetical protein